MNSFAQLTTQSQRWFGLPGRMVRRNFQSLMAGLCGPLLWRGAGLGLGEDSSSGGSREACWVLALNSCIRTAGWDWSPAAALGRYVFVLSAGFPATL